MVRRTRVTGAGLLNSAINALPFELHIPGYQFCGPGTKLAKRLARGDRGVNPLDAACREHDIAYSRDSDLAARHAADRVLTQRAGKRVFAKDAGLGERAAAATVWAAMKVKTKLGMGVTREKKTKKKKRLATSRKKQLATSGKTTMTAMRTLPTAKRGGLLPLLPVLGALGSLIGGAAGVAKAVNDRKTALRQLEELQRHNRAMEGRGLYLAPYKRGRGGVGGGRQRAKQSKKKIALDIDLPSGVTTNVQLDTFVRRMRIPFFRGVFMRDALPTRPRANESGIVNLDDTLGPGTHWVAYAKRGKNVVYFDGFGNLRPPRALERYLGRDATIVYNRRPYQTYDQSLCGQLCLRFLRDFEW